MVLITYQIYVCRENFNPVIKEHFGQYFNDLTDIELAVNTIDIHQIYVCRENFNPVMKEHFGQYFNDLTDIELAVNTIDIHCNHIRHDALRA